MDHKKRTYRFFMILALFVLITLSCNGLQLHAPSTATSPSTLGPTLASSLTASPTPTELPKAVVIPDSYTGKGTITSIFGDQAPTETIQVPMIFTIMDDDTTIQLRGDCYAFLGTYSPESGVVFTSCHTVCVAGNTETIPATGSATLITETGAYGTDTYKVTGEAKCLDGTKGVWIYRFTLP